MVDPQVEWERVPEPDGGWHYAHIPAKQYSGDARWPVKCATCEHVFAPNDEWQVFSDHLYRAPDGALLTRRELPIGAMWNEPWLAEREHLRGFDGMSIHVRLPDGRDWCVDSRANNCDKPLDYIHRCWVRHGDVRAGIIHVDKNGNTCGAGAGSIDTGTWHGFLHNSVLHP